MKRRAAREPEKARLLRLRTEDIYGGFALSKRRADVTLLAASIARHGLLSPLVVRRNAQAGRYALVCGARRLAACRMLGMREVDALLIEGDEHEAAACYLEEHWTREGVPCVDEAAAAAQAAEGDSGFALPGSMLLRRLRLAALGERVRAYAREEGMTLEQAEPLLMIPGEEMRLEAATIIAQRALTGAQARRLVAGERGAREEVVREAATGRRRATREALRELSAVAERLNAQGVDASVTVHSQDGGICVRIMLKNAEKTRVMQEKKGEREN